MKSISRTFNRLFISRYFIQALFLLIISASCEKEPDDNKKNSNTPVSKAVYVLNQGSYSANNSTVTLFDLETEQVTADDFFSSVNDREIGDTGADLLIYGSKAYIITNGSSQLEIVNAETFKHIKQIPFIKGGAPQQPSAIAGYKNHVYICAYDNTVTVIDTTTLSPVKTITVGLNPDAILASGGMIWVSNSGGLNFPNYDKTVSVIDPTTLTEVKKIDVGLNPYTLNADAYGDIYVITRGNYGDEKMRLKVIDSKTQTLKHTFDQFEPMNFTIKGDTAYVYHYDYFGTNGSTIMTINVKTEQVISNSFITDGSTVQAIYSIAVDPTTSDVFIGDAKDFSSNGVVHRYSKDGKLKYSFPTGVNPVAIRFLTENK